MNKAVAFLHGMKSIGQGIVTAIKSRFSGAGGEQETGLTLEDMGIYDMKVPYQGKRIMYNRGREDYFEMVISFW